MNDVFISYSRRDKVFTQKLYEALKAVNREVWADWDSIPAASDWDAEIKQGIQETNSVLFVLSPEWIKSNECRKEMVHAVAMGKRLFPILYLPVDPSDVPPELAKINWVYLRDADDFDKGFQTLCSAMDTDLEWIKTHTRIQVRALEWEKKKRDHSFVLRGNDLTEGEQFIASGANKNPVPTSLQSEYIFASRMDATKRQRQTLTGVTVALVVSIALGVAAVFQWQEANKQATISRSQVLAISATLNEEEKSQNLLLSIEAMSMVADYSFAERVEAEKSLRSSLGQLGGIPLSGFDTVINQMAFSQDSKWLATGTGHSPRSTKVLVWDMRNLSKEPLIVQDPEDVIYEFAFSPDSQWLATGSCRQRAENEACSQGLARLWKITNPGAKPITLIGHKDAISKLAFSPDGKWLATGSDDNIVQLWDLEKPSPQPEVLQGTFSSFAFSPDSQWLATRGLDGIAHVWDIKHLSTQPMTLQIPGDGMLTFSPDGLWLAIGGEDTTWLLNMKDLSEPPNVLPSSNSPLVFSVDGKWLATAGSEGTSLLWNTRNLFESPLTLQNTVAPSAFSPDGKWLIARGVQRGRFRDTTIWDMANPGSEPIILEGYSNFRRLIVSPDGQWLATEDCRKIIALQGTFQCYQNGVRLWNIKDHRIEPARLGDYGNAVNTIAFSPDGHWLAAADRDARLWSTKSLDTPPIVLPDKTNSISSLVFSADGQQLTAWSYESKTVQIWNMKNFSEQTVLLQAYANDFHDYAFSPDVQWFAASGCRQNQEGQTNCRIQIWNLRDPLAKPIDLINSESPINQLAFSPDSRWLAAGSAPIAHLWDLKSPAAQPITLKGHTDQIHTVAFSPDGQWLVTASFDGTARLWNLKNVSEEPVILQHENFLNNVTLAFSPDSQWLAVGGDSDAAQLWSLKDLSVQPILLQGHYNRVRTLAFSQDSQWLATAGSAGTRLWNVGSLNSGSIYLGQRGGNLVFSPDGKWLTDGGRFWNMDIHYLLDIACKTVGRNFTRDEWSIYFPNEEYRKTCEQWPLEPEITPTPTAIP